jgi:hypothetical protein
MEWDRKRGEGRSVVERGNEGRTGSTREVLSPGWRRGREGREGEREGLEAQKGERGGGEEWEERKWERCVRGVAGAQKV